MSFGRNIPVTIIGGFLGAGKTTLLNRLLTQSPPKTAVLVNDFGALNVDASLVKSSDELTLELSGGCICCSLAEGLGPALARAQKFGPDAIVIEASGVAEPRRIAEFALLDPGLRLDFVVTLANAVDLGKQLDDPLIGDTVVRQFDGADLIVLNHTDAASITQMTTARIALKRIAPGRPIVETVRSNVPLDLLTTNAPAILASPAADLRDHDSVFDRYALDGDQSFDRVALEAALDDLPTGLLRLKGWVEIEGEGPHLLQYVNGRWELSAAEAPRPGTHLVGIGTVPDLSIERLLGRAMAA